MRTFQILGRLALTLLCFALPQAAAAAGKIDKAVQILEQQARAGRGEFVTFLMGAASAYRWDSTAPEGPGAERLFCPSTVCQGGGQKRRSRNTGARRASTPA